MGTKNNPDNRGGVTALRKFNGKTVKPVLYIKGKNRFIAAAYEDGNVVLDSRTGIAIPYKNI